MRPTLLLLSALAAVSASPSIDVGSTLPADIGDKFAIFKATSSAATSTSFTLEHTKITITKHQSASSSAVGAGRRPRYVFTDAHAKGLVCLPKGSIGAGRAVGGGGATVTGTTVSGGPEVVVDPALIGGEAGKADLVVGQGEDVVVSVGAASSAAAAGGGSSAAASAGGGGGASSAAASGGGSAAASSGGGSATASGDGAGGGSAAAVSGDGSYDVDASGGGKATVITGGGDVITTGGGDGAAGGRIVDERFCTCVPSYLCGEDGFINTFGAGIIDIRSFAGKAPARDYVSKCKLTETCCNFRDNEPIGWQPSQCGERAPIRLDRRIVAGTASGLGTSPWMVALLLVDDAGNNDYVCGGSLIAEDVVLTGAHCVHKHAGKHLVARVGEWDTSSVNEVYPHDDIDVLSVLEHEEFNDKTLFNDVALLKLARPAEITTHVNTICLPDAEHFSFDKAHCVATGWGKESFGDTSYPNILKEVHLGLVSHDVCELALRQTRLSSYFQLHDSFTCAGGQAGVDTCVGDGGSPLVCRVPAVHEGDDDTFVQVGIVAWGIGCGKGGVPGVYADVLKLLPWIQTHLAQLTTIQY